MAILVPQLAFALLAISACTGNNFFAAAVKRSMYRSEDMSLSRLKPEFDFTANSLVERFGSGRKDRTIESLKRQMQLRAGKCAQANAFQDPWLKDDSSELASGRTAQTSLLQVSQDREDAKSSRGFTAHIAATGHFDEMHEIVHVGLNIDGELDGCLGPECVTVCWCDDGAFLNVRGFQYAVTSITHQGQSLCMGKCPMSAEFENMIGQGKSEQERTYTFQVEEIPNAPFSLTVQAVEHWDTGLLKVHVSFGKGSLGHLVPGYICIACCRAAPMSLLVTDINVGCINSIKTSRKSIDVQRSELKKWTPTYRVVMLGGEKYYLPNEIPDQTDCLAHRVRDLLIGGDAIVETCPVEAL